MGVMRDDSAYAVSSSSSKVLLEYPCRDRPSLADVVGEERENGGEDVMGDGGRLRNGVQEQTTDDVHYFRITTNILHFVFPFTVCTISF